MHTNLKGIAVLIACALYPTRVDGSTLTDEQREDVLYDTVCMLLFTDEQKAHLYAMLAEKLTATTGYPGSIGIIERAIHECQRP